MWLEGDLLLGYYSDSVCIDINNVSLDRTFIVCNQGGQVVGGILETGGYSLRCAFLTKDSQPFTVEINHVSLDTYY